MNELELVPVLLSAHCAATLTMTGLIWFVQLVHYPLFPHAAAGEFTAFALAHQRRTGVVVVSLMMVEAATALLLPANVEKVNPWLGLSLLILIWLSTALVQVPLQRRLARGFDPATTRRLVRSNWVRTTAWTGRGVLSLLLLHGQNAA